MEITTNEQPKSFNPKWIYIGIITALLAVSIYLFVSKNKTETQLDTTVEEKNQVINDKSAIETEYNAALARLDEMKNESVQMDSLLTTKSVEVEALKRKINSILSNKNATAAQLREANTLIAELKGKMNSYQEQITALKQENVQLTEDKKQLIQDKEAVTQEKEALKEDKKSLEKTVEVGSVLHASGFKMEVINKVKTIFGKEKEKETEKARKADLMRISFDIDDNRISESGDKIIYICVTDPKGNISGNNKFKLADNSEKIFTVTKTIPYRQGEKVYGVTSEWHPISNFEPGTYKVEIYHMGYKIGSEKVNLK